MDWKLKKVVNLLLIIVRCTGKEQILVSDNKWMFIPCMKNSVKEKGDFFN